MLLTASAAVALTGLANAQTGGVEDYNFNWHQVATTPAVFTAGAGLFGVISGTPNFYGVGDSIRTCYGIDQFQGGRNQSDGATNITWIAWTLGHAVVSAGPDVGLSSVIGATVDSLEGDACLSGLFIQGTDSTTGLPITLNETIGVQLTLGFIAGLGTGGGAFASIAVELVGSNAALPGFGVGVQIPNTLGVDPTLGFPLLPHIIFENQGPVNEGLQNNQYFLASTTETIGIGTAGSGTGGVTNGNALQGFGPLGATADASLAYSPHRFTGMDNAGVFVGITTVFFTAPQNDVFILGSLATQTPATWAISGTSTGAGGPDWVVSTDPVATVNLRTLDVRAGGEGDTLSSLSTGLAPLGASIDNPGLAFNAPFYLWSGTPAGMLQLPFTWDTTLGFPSPGSQILGPQATSRAGAQTVPINFDALTGLFLGVGALTVGGPFSSAVDIQADGVASSLFDLGLGTGSEGESLLPVAVPIVPAANPGLAGTRIGIASAGVQFDVIANTLNVTEFSSGVTVVLQ